MQNNKQSVDQVTQEVLKTCSTDSLSYLVELSKRDTVFLLENNQAVYGWTFNESREFIENITLAHKMLVQGIAA